MISLITALVVLTLVRAGLSGSDESKDPLFHSPQSDSGSSDGSRSSDGPGMPSSPNEVAPVDHEPARDRADAGDDRRDGLVGPGGPGPEQQAARGRADRAADDRPPAYRLAAQVRHPLVVLLAERAVLP